MTGATASNLMVCGWDEVSMLDMGRDPPPKVWSWRAAERPELADVADEFKTTDECKPVKGGQRILITSSSGGVAVVERETGEAVFHTTVPNAHSAELLPGGRLAVASSGAWGWNKLLVFDLDKPDEPVCEDELPWAHGAVWDAERDVLWALGDIELRVYALRDWDSPAPWLERAGAWELPMPGGHDLSARPGSPYLIVTAGESVYLFDRAAVTFAPHPDLGRMQAVKSASVHPTTGRLAHVQAEAPNWWAERIHFLHPTSELHLPGEHIYKARWAG